METCAAVSFWGWGGRSGGEKHFIPASCHHSSARKHPPLPQALVCFWMLTVGPLSADIKRFRPSAPRAPRHARRNVRQQADALSRREDPDDRRVLRAPHPRLFTRHRL